MDCTERRRAEREAYATCVRLQWDLYRLPLDAPGRQALSEEVRRADRYWRGLMGVPDIAPRGEGRLREASGQIAYGSELTEQ